MDVFEAIERRASVRGFEPVEVPDEDLEKILDAGRRAALGSNVQPREFIAIRSRATLQSLARAQDCIAQAAAAILIVVDENASAYWLEDASASAENMLLAIVALGYDSVWIQGTLSRHTDSVREELGIPANKTPLILLPIGKAAAPPSQAVKKPLSEIVHRERYGQRDE